LEQPLEMRANRSRAWTAFSRDSSDDSVALRSRI
jgi:hypothetical protein